MRRVIGRSCGQAASPGARPRILLGFLAASGAAAAAFWAVRRSELPALARQSVSPRGGNKLAFTGAVALLRRIFGLLGPLDVAGTANVPVTGGVLIVPNHQSDCDVLALGAALPRFAWYLAKEELFEIPVVGFLMRQFHAFPIRRTGAADRAAMKQVLELLSEGEAVVIFPEGQESEDGTLQEFQQGAAMLALRAQVLVVPAAIYGTRNVLPYGQFLPRRSGKNVFVRFGKPMDLSAFAAVDRSQRNEQATAAIRAAIASMLRDIAPDSVPANAPDPVENQFSA